jgi:hypothetical protein
MDKILSQRFDFYDFKKIVGFPNPLPSRDEYPNVKEQVYSAEYFSPEYEAKIDEKLATKTREDSSMFFPSFLESKAEFFCCSYKRYAEDIQASKQTLLTTLLMTKK